ncbi:hypothetical protein B0T16DRAFT_408104 [Cercophora newfieldiana]|uniref:Uncharacterized protein n=1 Tax=Cercophora newfieldiana TaxID=92897 RepID=A0AA40CR55_9PEZI|nr:hypothetical protein B0T16DRAFT_408104 [Cercophora newfieldiana]
MKAHLFLVALAQILLSQPALAENFHIWLLKYFSTNTDKIPDQQFVLFVREADDPVTCAHVLDGPEIYLFRRDLSESIGAECDGWGCEWDYRDPKEIQRLEMSTTWGHYTYYIGGI